MFISTINKDEQLMVEVECVGSREEQKSGNKPKYRAT